MVILMKSKNKSIDDEEWQVVEAHLKKIDPEMKAINKALSKQHEIYYKYINFKDLDATKAIRLDIVMENITKGVLSLIDIIQLWERVLKLHSVTAITEGSEPSNAGSIPAGAVKFTLNIKEETKIENRTI